MELVQVVVLIAEITGVVAKNTPPLLTVSAAGIRLLIVWKLVLGCRLKAGIFATSIAILSF